MFYKSAIKDDGIDITIKNNPGHVLSPDDWEMVMGVKFGKITAKQYHDWYLELIRSRWEDRKQEFLDLAREGLNKDIRLKCFCPKGVKYCHAEIAVKFMNALVQKLKAIEGPNPTQ